MRALSQIAARTNSGTTVPKGVRRQQAASAEHVVVRGSHRQHGSQDRPGTEPAEAVDYPQTVRPEERARLVRCPTGRFEEREATAGQLEGPETDEEKAGCQDHRVLMIDHDCGGKGGAHAQRHKYGREAEIEDGRPRRKLTLALKGVGEEGRQKKGAARREEREDAADEGCGERYFENGSSRSGSRLRQSVVDVCGESLGRLSTHDQCPVDEERRRTRYAVVAPGAEVGR